ncbi:MAG: adenosylcobinamide-phosphate synthase CbiB [Desulfohalobiaceae bacterium]
MTNLLPLLAFVLDLGLKDPQDWPHPVRWIGKILERLEKLALAQSLFNLQAAGAACLGAVLLVVLLFLAVLTSLPLLGPLLGLYLAYAGLALGGLLQSARSVLNSLELGNLEQARLDLGLLVSRDTSNLDREGICRTLAETVSENFNDGFVAPMFYLCLGGPVLLWLYKTVSTMDSMWGYKHGHYLELGWAGAKLDDLLAWIPARLSAGLIIIIALFSGLEWRKAWQKSKEQARNMESPNAGWPMAAAAWSIGGQMGGQTMYQGWIKQKPLLGPAGSAWGPARLRNLLRLLLLAGCLAAGLGQIWVLLWI